MTDQPDIAAFLIARINEDERTAQHAAAEGAEWRALSLGTTGSVRPVGNDDARIVRAEDVPLYGQAVHIARWDPARVLADCAARRAIVAEAQRRQKLADEGYYDDHADLVDLTWLLLLLVQAYADHPAFDSAWRLKPASPPNSRDTPNTSRRH